MKTEPEIRDEADEDSTPGNSSWRIAYRQFKKDRIAVGAFFSLVAVGLIAVFSPLLANNKPIIASYQDGIHFPALKDYLDENIPVPPPIQSWFRRSIPSLFSPSYPSIKRPSWQQLPDWVAIRREIDANQREIDKGAKVADTGWYLMPPVPYYYKQNSSGIKLFPGYSLAHLTLPAQGAFDAESLEFVPERAAEQELSKIRRRLAEGQTASGRIVFDTGRLKWALVDPSGMAVLQPKDWQESKLELELSDGAEQGVAYVSPEDRPAGHVASYWEWRTRYLPDGAKLEESERVLERALRFWRQESPRPVDFQEANWTKVQGHPAIRAHTSPTQKEAERLIGPEATAKTLYLIFAPDRVFTVLVEVPGQRRDLKGAYEGPLHEELEERVLAGLTFQAPSGTTRVDAKPVVGRRFLETGQTIDMGGVQGEFIQDPPFRVGTDSHGRCVLSRLIHGAVIAGSVGVVSVGIYVFIGVILGALAGYFRGWVDLVISRVIEIVISFPTLFLIIMIVGVLQEPSIYLIMIALGLLRWTGVARLVRGEFLKTMSEEYVSAAKAMGLPTGRIIFRHILPNSISPVFVSASFGVAGAILIETSLSFLGFGVAPPTASWGEILRQGKEFVNENMYHLIWAPGFCIFFTVTMFNIVGEGLRDALDPKLRK